METKKTRKSKTKEVITANLAESQESQVIVDSKPDYSKELLTVKARDGWEAKPASEINTQQLKYIYKFQNSQFNYFENKMERAGKIMATVDAELRSRGEKVEFTHNTSIVNS